MERQRQWKNFFIRPVVEEDISSNKLVDFINQNFHSDEPMGKLVAPTEELVQITNNKIQQMVRVHMDICFVAVDTVTNEIAGIQLQFIWKKEDALFQQSQEANSKSSQSPFKLRRFMDAVYLPMNERRYGIFDQFGVTQVVWNFLACTGRNYRGIGLSSEMYSTMVTVLQEKGHKIVFSIFSSPFSRKCATKVGFTEIARSYYNKARDEDGLYFVLDADKEEYAAVMVLNMSGK